MPGQTWDPIDGTRHPALALRDSLAWRHSVHGRPCVEAQAACACEGYIIDARIHPVCSSDSVPYKVTARSGFRCARYYSRF